MCFQKTFFSCAQICIRRRKCKSSVCQLLPESFTHTRRRKYVNECDKEWHALASRQKAASVCPLTLCFWSALWETQLNQRQSEVLVGHPKKGTSQTDNDTTGLGCSRLIWQAPFQRRIKEWKHFQAAPPLIVASLSGGTGRQLWAEPAAPLCRSGVFISATSAAMHLRVFPTQRWPTAIYLSLKTKSVFHSPRAT